jgi:hypothetical protein
MNAATVEGTAMSVLTNAIRVSGAKMPWPVDEYATEQIHLGSGANLGN